MGSRFVQPQRNVQFPRTQRGSKIKCLQGVKTSFFLAGSQATHRAIGDLSRFEIFSRRFGVVILNPREREEKTTTQATAGPDPESKQQQKE